MIFMACGNGYHGTAGVPSTFLLALRHCRNAGISGNTAFRAYLAGDGTSLGVRRSRPVNWGRRSP
jgi:hypothetical protein